jgi:hypothetical protein
MIVAAALLAALAAPPARTPLVQAGAQCLHAPGRESQEERQRSVGALSATRAINTAEAAYIQKTGSFATRQQLAGLLDARFNLADNAEILPGFVLTLDLTPKGYWFSIADKTDPCGYRFISNQEGVIFTAYPIQ